MSEFKISRLRFSWAGPWTDQTAYNKDEIVQYNGKAYVCLIPHTSNEFYNDLGAAEPKWELMMTGQTWKGTWQPLTQYALDNIVIFGGIVYKCNEQHLSGAVLDLDIDKWDVYAESKTWASEWTSSTTYGVGDIVNYGGSVYECIVSHISADTDLAGLEADFTDVEDSTEKYWEILKEGVQWRGIYATDTEDSSQLRYKLNDIVKYGPSLYKCIWGHAPANEFVDFADSTELYETFISEYWEEWLPGLDFGNVWDNNTVYQPGDVVLYGGYLFQNKIINNINIKPSTSYGDDSTDAWELITQAYEVTGEWDSVTEYRVGSVVTYGGDLYVSLVDTTNQKPGDFIVTAPYESENSSGTRIQVNLGDSVDPNTITVGMTVTGEGFARGQSVVEVSIDNDSSNASMYATITLNEAPDGTITDGAVLTFSGALPGVWELLIPGFNWEGQWIEDTLYNQDDVAYYGNATYRCVREHTSTLVSRPDLDLQNTYWVLYLQHDQRNTLYAPGQMIIFDGEENSVLEGATSGILKSVNGLPVWSDIDFTPNVYYVATNGVDAPNRGTTPDSAWATIKYACERVELGTRQANARELLEQNDNWIVQETFYWFLHQQNQLIEPFDSSYNFDNEKTIRDARLVLEGVIRDLVRGGNAVTVENTLAYFDLESTNKFTTELVAEQAIYFQAFFVELFNNIERALTNTVPAQSYQVLEGVENPVTQYFNSNLTLESDTLTIVGALEKILLTAFAEGSPNSIPPANEAAYTTIMIRSGTYNENLPIVVPAYTALNGDELRGTTVQPAAPVSTLCTNTFGFINQFVVGSTLNMFHNCPVQFVSLNPVGEISTVIGGVTPGQTYYVIGSSITDTRFSVSEVPDGDPVEISTNIGDMYVYGGEALSDMFRVRNATGIRNMTCKGLRGTLSDENEFLTRRPTGGSYVSLDPGEGPSDTSAWITKRSPYIQNVTNFGKGCVGMKIDSTLHEGGNRSMTCNDFTQIISDGIGVWCKGGDALVECVSVFSYYNYAGYFAEDGAKIRATNGNSSYGTYGVVAEGFDISEIPATGVVNNRESDASAEAVSALGANAEILKLQYTHAGESYFEKTTNMLLQSNNLLDENVWITDGNVAVIRASTTPYAGEQSWKVSANTSLTDSAYFYQDVEISPQGRTYTNVGGSNISGSGIDATFDVTVFSDAYVVAVNNGGSGYVVGNQITLSGTEFGGRSPENDITITVDSLSITSILTVVHEGTVPEGSALPYNVSIHAKKGTSSYFDMYAIFSGYSDKTSHIRFNFDTGEAQTFLEPDGGITPVAASGLYVRFISDGWYRVEFTFWDATAQNDSLRLKVYPRGIDGIAGYTDFYGAQLTIGQDPKFFLNTGDGTPSSYANINIVGAGSGVSALGDELRTGAIYEARLLEASNARVGGLGYKLQSNNAQSGTPEYLTLAQSEVGTAAEYEGMRIVVQSGKGAGQYGIISDYNPTTKRASVTQESFGQQEVVATDDITNRLILGTEADYHKFYPGQKVQFTPTFYNIDVLSASQSSVQVLGTLGDLNNYMFVSSTDRLRVGQKINFSGTPFGGVITGFDYYIIDIIDERSIQISTADGGAVWPLTNVNIDDPDDSPIVLTNDQSTYTLNYPDDTFYFEASTTDNMEVTLPIQFTGTSLGGVDLGTTYYIHDVYSSSLFSISSSLIEENVSATSSTNNGLTVADSSIIKPLNALVFKGTTLLGGLQEKTRYYVSGIIDGTTITVSDSVTTRTATASEAVTNLITVDSTAGFIVNSPVTFTGVTFGGLVNNQVYYIQVINDATSFTISEVPGGAAVPLNTAVGEIIVRTTQAPVVVTDDTGSMTLSTTGNKFVLESDRGEGEGSFFTEIFGGISAGTTYYVLEKFDSSPAYELTISETENGAPFNFNDDTGSMQLNSVGWDHINAGTPLVTTFDSTSVYQIEPRVTIDEPPFIVETIADIPTSPGPNFNISKIVSNGKKIFAIEQYGFTAYSSTSGTSWDQVYTLPVGSDIIENGGTGGWVDATHGNNTWFILSATGEQCLYSVSDGLTWLTVDLPTLTTGQYTAVTYGNGVFIAVANGDYDSVAYSTNNCSTWTQVNTSAVTTDNDWRDIAYGNKKFVIIDGSSHTAIYSTDNGQTWNDTLLDNSQDSTVTNWRTIEFGNNRFVALSPDDRPAAYSFDGANWYNSNVNISGTVLTYGQGVFVSINNTNGICCTSSDGINWDLFTDTVGGNYGVMGYMRDDTEKGWFVAVGPFAVESFRISAGARALARATVNSTQITSISLLEAGSGYTDDSFGPTVRITDPNNSEEAIIQLRVGNGSLGAPSFVSFGSGYNTASTSITVRGSGYADIFQTGLKIICDSITRFPSPGDNIQFEGNPEIYRVAKAESIKGTVTPNLLAEITISPQLTEDTAPIHDTPITIRSRFSQCRITNHDYLNVGFGNELQSNYPNLPLETGLEPQDEVQETNNGRVFYSSTDQDGNFRVGELFAVEQATGIVTLSADEFGLDGLSELSIGGVALGGSPVTINAFSIDGTFVANSNNLIPTQRAIRTYLASRLSQGGSDTFTGLLTAGTVKVGGPDIIESTVPEGGEGWQVKIGTKAMFDGPFGNSGWAGDGLALSYFMKTFSDPTRSGQQ